MFEAVGVKMPEWVELQTIEDNQYWIEEDQSGIEDIFNVYEVVTNPYGKMKLLCQGQTEYGIYLTYRQDYQIRFLDSFTWDDDRILGFLTEDEGEIHDAIIDYLRRENLVPRISEFVCGDLEKEVLWKSTYEECFVEGWYHVSSDLAKCLVQNGDFTLKLGNFYFWGRNGAGSPIKHDPIWERISEVVSILAPCL